MDGTDLKSIFHKWKWFFVGMALWPVIFLVGIVSFVAIIKVGVLYSWGVPFVLLMIAITTVSFFVLFFKKLTFWIGFLVVPIIYIFSLIGASFVRSSWRNGWKTAEGIITNSENMRIGGWDDATYKEVRVTYRYQPWDSDHAFYGIQDTNDYAISGSCLSVNGKVEILYNPNEFAQSYIAGCRY